MDRTVNVFLFAASLRKDSLNHRLITQVRAIVEERGAAVHHAPMSELDCPSYDGDVEDAQGIPDGARRLHDALAACDAFMIAAPEYNGSTPGLLKNAIDWASRFRPQPFNGKQAPRL